DCSQVSVEGIDPANFEKNSNFNWKGWDDETQTLTVVYELPALEHDYEITYTNEGETHTKVETCTHNAEHVVKTAGQAHVYDEQTGKCVCGAEKPVVEEETHDVTVNGVHVEKLEDALEQAAASETPVEIKLLRDAELTDAVVTIEDGVTLDLNGNTLKVAPGAYVIACFETSVITDTSTGDKGRLNVDLDHLLLLRNNDQLPVKTDEGTMFVDVALEGIWSQDNCFKFWLADETEQAFVDEMMTNYANSEVKLQVELSWNQGKNKLVYTFGNDVSVLGEYLKNWKTKALKLNVTGADGITDLTYTAKLIFAEDTEAEVNKASAKINHGGATA
ncbi:MAG: hypothetical protein J6Q54_03630, partial [Oscillospiraceae bacterium]|nr:hypothetical protein [Oscillospiraceae bacterium]